MPSKAFRRQRGYPGQEKKRTSARVSAEVAARLERSKRLFGFSKSFIEHYALCQLSGLDIGEEDLPDFSELPKPKLRRVS